MNADATSISSPLDAFGGWKGLIGSVSEGHDLTAEQAGAAMEEILAGDATHAQIAGFVIGLKTKGETTEEMTGMVRAMLGASQPLTAPDGAIDIVGTGGSQHRRSHALNVSTMSCFVAASAGATVSKHGNYKASSTSGAFDFLQAVGVDVDISTADLEAQMATHGLGFVLARAYHPALRHAGPVRVELGVPTVFNVLGPLAHPAQPKRQVVGTSSEARAAQMAEVLQQLGSERAWVVAGHDGLDELSTIGSNVVFDVTPSAIDRIEISAADVGIEQPSSMDELAGGGAEENLAIFTALLAGEASDAHTDIVMLNAAAGLVVAGIAEDLRAGVALARAAIADGRTKALVEAMTAA